MLNLTHCKHTAELLTDFDRCSTNQYRTTGLYQTYNLLDYGFVLFTLGLVYAVILIDTCNGLVGGDYNHIQLIDIPELTCLCLSGTGHTGQLVIHTEVVLKCDCCECLGCGLNVYTLLGLNCLVQSVAPAATLHDTAGLLINDLDLAVLGHDVVNIALKHAVGLEQLVDGMYALALYGVVGKEFVLLGKTLLLTQVFLVLKLRQLGCDIGQDKEIGILVGTAYQFNTLVSQVYAVEFLIDYKVEGFYSLGHTLVLLLHVDLLGLLHAHLDTGLAEELDKSLVLGQGLETAEQ